MLKLRIHDMSDIIENSLNRFKDKLIPNVPRGAVIVMDNAPYHSVLEDSSKMPTRKEDIIKWLDSRGNK